MTSDRRAQEDIVKVGQVLISIGDKGDTAEPAAAAAYGVLVLPVALLDPPAFLARLNGAPWVPDESGRPTSGEVTSSIRVVALYSSEP